MPPLFRIFFPSPGRGSQPGCRAAGSRAVSEPLCICKREVVASSVQRLRVFTPVASLGVQQSGMPNRNASTGALPITEPHATNTLPKITPCLLCELPPSSPACSLKFALIILLQKAGAFYLENPTGTHRSPGAACPFSQRPGHGTARWVRHPQPLPRLHAAAFLLSPRPVQHLLGTVDG